MTDSQTDGAPTIHELDTEAAHKTAFADEFLHTPGDPFRAALAVFPDDTNKALRIANDWPSDEFVILEMARLRAEKGELAYLPSKADLAQSLWARAHKSFTADADFAKITRLYAEVMDFVPKVSKIDANVKTSSIVRVVASPLDEEL